VEWSAPPPTEYDVLFTLCVFVTGRAMGITDTINPSEIKKPVHEVSEFTIYNHKLIRVLNWVRNFSDEEFKDDICWVVGGVVAEY
jgi:hypothetical protein